MENKEDFRYKYLRPKYVIQEEIPDKYVIREVVPDIININM